MKIYLDDLRPCLAGYVPAYTAGQAISLLKTGQVSEISFDHDLGPEEAGTGYQVAKFIEESAFSGTLTRLTYKIHSANPVGRLNIDAAMRNAVRFWDSK
jgi:hypothetical protein